MGQVSNNDQRFLSYLYSYSSTSKVPVLKFNKEAPRLRERAKLEPRDITYYYGIDTWYLMSCNKSVFGYRKVSNAQYPHT